MRNILDPKNPWRSKDKPSLFEYYAGFSTEFAKNIVTSYSEIGSRVLDPWNGAGTTTFACSRSQRYSTGVDINPAAILTAKAKLAHANLLQKRIEHLKQYLSKSRNTNIDEIVEHDILSSWLNVNSTKVIRSLIRETNKEFHCQPDVRVEDISNEHAFLLKIIASVLRSYIHPLTGSNPTWIKISKNSEEKINIDKRDFVNSLFQKIDQNLTSHEAVLLDKGYQPTFICQDSRKLELDQDFDLILGSPPYCTRIDYAVKTLPEAAVLGISSTLTLGEFRKNLLGSTITSRDITASTPIPLEWGETCIDFLNKVKRHPSKASDTYYYRFHYNYYSGLYSSIQTSASHLKKHGCFVIVVQDSYYKEVRNDLPTIVEEMLSSNGIELNRRENFSNNGSFSLLNSAAAIYGKKKYVESVIIGKKK